MSWLGDAIRQSVGYEVLDFPDQKDATANLAKLAGGSKDIQVRYQAVENLRKNLETNVQEGLALEVAFLNAFGYTELL